VKKAGNRRSEAPGQCTARLPKSWSLQAPRAAWGCVPAQVSGGVRFVARRAEIIA